ncbi:MAG: hypothetical protein V1688_02105 [bacterium]
MPHHLIFEGPELAGKSWLMSRVYDFLEARYNNNNKILDGCHWFNSDVGVFGTEHGKFCIEKYLEMLETLKNKNVLFEKFHISDTIYNRLHRNIKIDYSFIENELKKLDAKIILCTFNKDVNLIKKRIKDRLNLYPHYERILQDPKWYISQQDEYLKEIKKTGLPYLIVDLTEIPNEKDKEILEWIGEKFREQSA